jgi:O-antigen ligase
MLALTFVILDLLTLIPTGWLMLKTGAPGTWENRGKYILLGLILGFLQGGLLGAAVAVPHWNTPSAWLAVPIFGLPSSFVLTGYVIQHMLRRLWHEKRLDRWKMNDCSEGNDIGD